MNVISEFANPVLKRKEVVVEADYDSNPGVEKVKKDLAGHFKSGEDSIAVKRVGGNFGRNEFIIEATIYSSKEDMDKIEPKKKEKKK